MSPAKAKEIEPINASFEQVMKVIVGAPLVEEPQPKIITTDKTLSNLLGKVHQSDCVKFMNEQLQPETISCIVTSPPYNLKNSTGNGMKAGTKTGKWPNNPLQNGYREHSDDMPHDKYVLWQRECLTAMMRVLKNDGVIFYNHKWRVQGGLLQDRHDIVQGFPVRQIIIWKRAGGINFNPGYFLPTYEVIYMICKPDFKLADGANKMTDVWEIPQVKGNEHPAPFPVELASKCIEASPGGIVLDPFMGSGTTAISAISHNREWLGIELSKDYCTLAKTKISQYIKKAQIKP